ncbi:MAG TPA: FHA domain-containing protein [Anaerolineaceae bacterium]
MLGGAVSLVFAQTGGTVTASVPEIIRFPLLRINFEAYDSSGNFINNLKPEAVSILEDGIPRQIDKLERLQPGAQIIIAMNISPLMATITGNQSAFDRIRSGLVAWAQRLPNSTNDDFTLATNTGFQVSRLRNPQQWASSIDAYQPDLQKSQMNLTALIQAIDLATDPSNRPNVKRGILYITPPLPRNLLGALPNLANRARQANTPVHIWLVQTNPSLEAESLEALRDLSSRTGGSLTPLSPTTDLPDVDAYFQPLRFMYQVEYQSKIRDSSTHKLSVQVNYNTQTLKSAEHVFSITLQPPNPIFLQPPRLVHKAEGTNKSNATPVPLQILIEFPDGFQRQIKATRLFVDGVLTVENTNAPFDRFNWETTTLNKSGQKILRIEVEDEFGFRRSSIDMPVEVLVEEPETQAANFIRWQSLVVIGGILISSIFIIVAVTTMYRRRKQVPKIRRRVQPPIESKGNADTMPQPPIHRFEITSWLRTDTSRSAYARLIPLDKQDHPLQNPVILLNRPENTFGSDPHQATVLINDPSVDKMHARMYHKENGDCILVDADSIAGTWVNLTPINLEGTRLEHGDILNFGLATFRFELTKPIHLPQPRLKTEEG